MITNGLFEFPEPATNDERIDNYVFGFTGADYNLNQHGFQTGRLFLNDQNLFKVYKNGTLMLNTEWAQGGWGEFAPGRRQVFELTAVPLVTDVFIFHYQETINKGADYRIKLY